MVQLVLSQENPNDQVKHCIFLLAIKLSKECFKNVNNLTTGLGVVNRMHGHLPFFSSSSKKRFDCLGSQAEISAAKTETS